MKNQIALLLGVFLGEVITWAKPVSSEFETYCFPQAQLSIPASSGFIDSGLSEEDFHRVLDRVGQVYEPIFAERQLNLKIIRLWENPDPNAKAAITEGNIHERKIYMFGGLARMEEMTADAFALVACHEIGHHLGGAPQKQRGTAVVANHLNDEVFVWHATNEGQADYFATLKCAREVFGEDDNQALMREVEVSEAVQESCASSFSEAEEEALCQRSTIAGVALGQVLHTLDIFRGRANEEQARPGLETPSEEVVSFTDDSHPLAQCRLDTYFQGALCPVDYRESLSSVSPEEGACSRELGDLVGVRPLCWYKPEGRMSLASF